MLLAGNTKHADKSDLSKKACSSLCKQQQPLTHHHLKPGHRKGLEVGPETTETGGRTHQVLSNKAYLGSACRAAARLSTPSWKLWMLLSTRECRIWAGVCCSVMKGMLVGRAHWTHCMIVSLVSFLKRATKNAACPFAFT